MENSKQQIENLVQKAEKAANDTEREQLNNDASHLHELATGGQPMKFDAHGHIDKNNDAAKKCPFLK